MRVAVVAVAAALAVALFLLLTMDHGAEPDTAAVATADGAAGGAAPSSAVPDADPAPATPGSGEPQLADAAGAAGPEDSGLEGEAAALVQRYREAAEKARERVAKLQPPPVGAGQQGPRPTGPLHRPFERPGPDMPESVRRAWEEHVGSLLYPPGHPREGQPLDHVTPEDLASAAAEVAASLLPQDMMDQPRRRIVLQQDFMTFHQTKRQHGPGQALADALEQIPPNPRAQRQDPYWIETNPADPKATTLRRYYYERGLEQAQDLFPREASGD